MSIYELALLFMSFAAPGEHDAIAARAPTVAWAAKLAVARAGSLFSGDDGVEATEKLLVRMIYLESRGDGSASNPAGDAGILQIRKVWWRGHSKAEVLADPVLGAELGLRALLDLRKACGGAAERWIGAYASGTCGGAKKVARLRCAPLGLCDRS